MQIIKERLPWEEEIKVFKEQGDCHIEELFPVVSGNTAKGSG